MNYLFVIPYFVPAYAYGGPVKGVYARATGLAKKGHTVSVYTTDVLDGHSRYKGPKEAQIDGIKIRYFPVISNKLAYYMNYFRAFGFYRHLKKTIHNFDFVFIHDFFTYQSSKTASLCKTHKIPYSVTPHGVLEKNHIQSRKILKKLFLLTNKHILTNADFSIALTTEEQKVLRLYLPEEKIKTIPNGINIDEYTNLKSLRGNLKTKFNLGDKKIILFIGRLQKIKGLDILAHAFQIVLKEINDTCLLIVGPDEGYLKPLKSILKTKGISSSVKFTGLLEGKELLEALADADIYTLTSHSEGLPMSVLEAAAAGLPCVISKGCNVPEINIYKAGYAVDNIPEIIAARIIKILKNDELRTNMGIQSKEMVRKQFTWETVIDKLEHLTLKY